VLGIFLNEFGYCGICPTASLNFSGCIKPAKRVLRGGEPESLFCIHRSKKYVTKGAALYHRRLLFKPTTVLMIPIGEKAGKVITSPFSGFSP